MAQPLTEQGGVARAFAEFTLLPELLALVPEHEGASWVPLWAALVEDAGCSLDHVEETDRPDGRTVWNWMAEDAFGLALRLGLMQWTEGAGLAVTEAGDAVASVATDPMGEAGGADEERLRSLLARQVRARYRGDGGIDAPGLLLEAAGAMQRTKHVWAKHCPGLLLVEFDALVHEAENDAERAERLLGELETNRDLAMHPHGRPGPASDPADNAVRHSDAVADFYLFDLEYDARSSLTITGVRASAMLFTFAGLLTEGGPVGPVQFLVPPPS